MTNYVRMLMELWKEIKYFHIELPKKHAVIRINTIINQTRGWRNQSRSKTVT